MAAKRKTPTFIDYVVRFSHPSAFMRSQVVRMTSEADALEWALHAVREGSWVGWTIVEVVTVPEAKARLGVARG